MDKPFLRWAGGKRWFVHKYNELLPTEYDEYHEPFFGSGAVYFYMNPDKANISDLNPMLMDTYLALQKNYKRVEQYLQDYQNAHSKEYYYQVRKLKPKGLYQRAALFIYLNRTSWNGLYRVNKNGKFNVPIGTRSNIVRDDDFSKLNTMLDGTTIRTSCFTDALKSVSKGDFIFIDPPYTVKHDNNGFIKYNENLFSWDDQVALSKAAFNLAQKGAKVLVLNANHSSILDLYSDLGKIHILTRSSTLSGKASSRGKTNEIAVQIGY